MCGVGYAGAPDSWTMTHVRKTLEREIDYQKKNSKKYPEILQNSRIEKCTYFFRKNFQKFLKNNF